MSNTIKDYIASLATNYQKQSELTEMDILAEMALTKAMKGCDELRCGLDILHEFRTNTDEYINRYFGTKGSCLRLFYEPKAKELLKLAQRYKDSSEEDKPNHPLRKAEAKFLRTEPLCGQ